MLAANAAIEDAESRELSWWQKGTTDYTVGANYGFGDKGGLTGVGFGESPKFSTLIEL
jgi:hypothetical protein